MTDIRHFGPATAEEIIYCLTFSKRISYRHFLQETYAPRARNGVQHRQKTTAKLHVIDGKPFVTYQGKLHEITADVCTINGNPVTYDHRLKSEYLK